jgi:hypothetical protein
MFEQGNKQKRKVRETMFFLPRGFLRGIRNGIFSLYRKKIVFLILPATLLTIIAASFILLVYFPEMSYEQRIAPLLKGGLTKDQAVAFDNVYGEWAPYNDTEVEFAGLWARYFNTATALLSTTSSLNKSVQSLSRIAPLINNGVLSDENSSDFIHLYPQLAVDDGLNETDVQLLKYYVRFPSLVNQTITKINSQRERLNFLESIVPYVEAGSLTEERAKDVADYWEIVRKVNPTLIDVNPTRIWPPFEFKNDIVYYFKKPFIKFGKMMEPGCFGIETIWDPVTGDFLGRQYVLFLVHNDYLESGNYNLLQFNITQPSGKEVEVKIYEADDDLGFVNTARLRIYLLEGYMYPIIEVNATIEFTKNVGSIKDLWVETGFWPPANWDSVTMKLIDGTIFTQLLLEHTGHYFKFFNFKSVGPGSWASTLGGDMLINRAMIFGQAKYFDGLKWRPINSGYVIDWVADDFGYKSIEFSLYNGFHTGSRLFKAGEIYNFVYHVVIGEGDPSDWIERIAEKL